jgi:hypothetical protein
MASKVELVDTDLTNRWWWTTKLKQYNIFILFLHALWVLPGATVAWDGSWKGVDSLLDVASIFGLRFGLGLKLRESDPRRIGAWELNGNSVLYDVLLFAVLAVQEPLLQSETMVVLSAKFIEASKRAATRASLVYVLRVCANVLFQIYRVPRRSLTVALPFV